MTSQYGLHLNTYVLIFAMAVFGPLGDLLRGKGMGIPAIRSWIPTDVFVFSPRALTSSTAWLGISWLFAFFIAYFVGLSWTDYSYVQPASTFSYGIVSLMAFFVFHETITPARWAGVLFICPGVFAVGHTSPQTIEPQP